MATCQFTPMFRYTWPGQDERFACIIHAQQWIGIADAMNFHLQMIPLSPDEMMTNTCSQTENPKEE